MSLQFTPSALGARLARLQVTDDAMGDPQSLPLVGFGINAAPALDIYPNALSFNSQPLGSSYQQAVTLQSVSSGPVSFSGVQITGTNAGDFTAVNDCPAAITLECYVYVTFTPSVTGVREAELQIQDNAAGSPQIVPLAGLGIALPPPAGGIGLSPNPLTFFQAQAVGYTTTASLGVNNTGTANVLLTGFHIGGRAASDFGIQTNNCPLSPAPLTPNAYCNISFEFTPSATGARVATFTMTDNASFVLDFSGCDSARHFPIGANDNAGLPFVLARGSNTERHPILPERPDARGARVSGYHSKNSGIS